MESWSLAWEGASSGGAERIESVVRPGWASGGGHSVEEDQPLEVVDEVRHADFHFGSGDADGSDEQPHPILLLGEDMFDVAADFRFFGIGAAHRIRDRKINWVATNVNDFRRKK